MHPSRYHPALVTLHWLLALLLILALALGSLWLEEIPNASPDKVGALRGHMIVGVLILALTLVRLAVRLRTRRPPPQSTGMAWADRLAALTHWTLYVLVIAMAASGIAMSLASGLPDVVFGGVGSLPPSFEAYVPRRVHGLVSKLLAVLVALHVAAALFHTLVRRDGLLSRMGYGKRRTGAQPSASSAR